MKSVFSKRSFLRGTSAFAATASLAPFSARASSRPFLAGVNIAGAEFGTLPGSYAKDYIYPDEARIAYYAQLGFNLIRVPFRWERLQPMLNQPLLADERERLAAVVECAQTKGMRVVLDTHNYAKRRIADDGWAKEYLIGSAEVPSAAFSDYCGRLANAFRGYPYVIFGLMNEPAQITANAWLPIANDGLASIRHEGADQLIFVPGTEYTGAHSWLSAHNDIMGNIADPAHNMAFEVHQYFDQDSSGTSPHAVNDHIGSERIAAFQNWARERGFKAFLGEFASGADEVSLAALRNICTKLENNRDVWIGWSAWAGGAWWGPDYFFNLEPLPGGQTRPQTKILSDFAKRQVAVGR